MAKSQKLIKGGVTPKQAALEVWEAFQNEQIVGSQAKFILLGLGAKVITNKSDQETPISYSFD